MEDMELEQWMQSVSPMDLTALVESLFSLGCFKHPAVKEAVLQHVEWEVYERVEGYSDEEVFTKYMEFNELKGTPVNLTEYLAEKREWEYESQSECDEPGWWEQLENEKTEHALKLLEDYEQKYGKKEEL